MLLRHLPGRADEIRAHLVASLQSDLEEDKADYEEFAADSRSGTGNSIADSQLRLEISYYYGLARDRSDVNDMLAPAILRYRAYLEALGQSYTDREQLDVDLLVRQPHILANIRELGEWAAGAVRLAADIQEANKQLTERLTSVAN